MNYKGKYTRIFQTVWIIGIWYILNVLFSFQWKNSINFIWSKLGFIDSYMIDCFLAVVAVLFVLTTGTQPFLWSKNQSRTVFDKYPESKRRALRFYIAIICIYLLISVIRRKPDIEFFSYTINNYYTYTQIPYYLIIALALVLFGCGLAYRAFSEETKLNFAVCCLIISFLVSPFFLIYTHSVEIFILQFLLQFTTLIVFCFYPSIWLAVIYETVMMYISFIFK